MSDETSLEGDVRELKDEVKELRKEFEGDDGLRVRLKAIELQLADLKPLPALVTELRTKLDTLNASNGGMPSLNKIAAGIVAVLSLFGGVWATMHGGTPPTISQAPPPISGAP